MPEKTVFFLVGPGSCLLYVEPPSAEFTCESFAPLVVDPKERERSGLINGVTCGTTYRGGSNYVWDFGDGSRTSTIGFVQHRYAAAGTYLVQVQVRAGLLDLQSSRTVTVPVP